MSDSEALGYVLTELYSINQSIYLRLPASKESLQQQLSRIRHSQSQLELLLQEVTRQARKRRRTTFKDCSPSLFRLIYQTARQAENYKILAEEFPLDSQGSMDCLARIQRRSQAIAQHIQALEKSPLAS
ncbi:MULTISPECIES: hypothetical protein [unclassified Leptolyngbya]|uniref:hypothetical protein n=1 Tax=unclassified Leptolyngbya TaxID=2650499 RepID=UPI00168511AB|nr:MULTISPECIES: hypothetical protein [unclassified Leptolyngbya]MBD1909472.1 hypothetical protein [Leptolyngbya sp. FACHB-8]MBD2153349.1 hypothetical protein [Leptolyngbya sp. FACHB-16]